MSNVTTQNMILKRSLRALLYRKHAALALLAPGMAFAGPTGEDVVGGDANIVRPDANRTVINQLTDRAAINWQTFNIDADEYVIFNQPGASSIVLNRVLGGDASYILGHLQANGQVFLLNPNGVYFTHGASLDVQGFLGATLDMDPNDFMAGDFTLSQSSDAPISRQVINDGVITAGPGGYVVLAGDYTENTGIITANAGSIALVSGNALTLDIEGDGLVNFAVDEATVDAYAGVRNTGSLIADGGRVIMTAKVANDLVATAVNNEGLVRARSVEERGGEIYLVGNGGDVINAGTLDADGENADGGGIAIYSDRDVVLTDSGVQTAAGDENHSGGVIRAIAEDVLDYQRYNVIRATGGVSGGFVEVSGHAGVNIMGTPDIGAGGKLLVDPENLAIADGGSGTNPGYFSNASSYTAVNTLGLPSYIVGSDDLSVVTTGWVGSQLNSGVDVLLLAEQNIFVDTNVSPTNIVAGIGGGNLEIAIGHVFVGTNTASIPLETGVSSGGFYRGGVFDSSPIVTYLTGGNIQLGGLTAIDIQGNITIRADQGNVVTGNLTTPGTITVSGGSIAIGSLGNAANVLVTANSAAASGGNINIGTGGFGSQVGNVTLNATGGANGGNITVERLVASGNLNFTASSTGGTNGGTVTVGAGSAFTGISDSAAGANVTINANAYNGQGGIYVGGGVTINTDVTGQMFLVGASTNSADFLTVNGNVSVSGNATAWVGGVSNAQINVSGSFSAANIELHAVGSGSGDSPAIILGGPVTAANNIDLSATAGALGGNISLGSYASAGGNLSMAATGASSGGNVTAGNLHGATGIAISASNTGTAGGNINVGTLSGGTISLITSASGISGGDITIAGMGSGIGAATLTANGATSAGGNITVTGAINRISDVTMTANGGAVGGDITTGNISGGAINLTANGGSASGGSITVGNVAGTSGAQLNASAGGIGNGGGVTAGNLYALNNGVVINANMNASIGPGVTINGTVTSVNSDATFNVANSGGSAVLTLNGDVTAANNVHANLSGLGANTLFVNGDITASSGNVVLAPGLIVDFGAGSHAVKAGGDIAIISGQLLVGSTAMVDYEAGNNFVYSGSEAFTARNVTGSNSVSINANGSSAGIAIENVSGNTINLTAVSPNYGGSISVAGVTGGTLAMSATGGSMGGGNITATGNIAVSGNVLVNAAAAPFTSFGGDITLQGVSGNNISLIANGDTSNAGLANVSTGNINATGKVFIDARFGSSHAFGDISATHIDAHFTPTINGNLNVSMGTLAVNGTTVANRDIVVELNMNTDAGPGGTSNGSLTIAGANAQNGEANFHILPEAPMGGSVTGNFTANGAITAAHRIDITAPDIVDTRALTSGRHVEIVTRNGDINTRAINVNNTVTVGAVVLDAGTQTSGANIFVDGGIAASGRPAAFDPLGAVVDLVVDGGSITVTGNINVTAAAGSFSNSNSQGFMGAGLVRMDAGAGGVISAANIGVNAVGRGFVQIGGENISTGNITQSIADGNVTQNSATSVCSGVACNLNGTSVMDGAQAQIAFFNTGGPGGTLNFGDVNMSAGNASFTAMDFANISGGAMTLVARGLDFSASSTGTYDGQAINFSETHQGGGATVYLAGSSNGVVQLTGAVDLQARGNARLVIMGDTIKVRDITVDASAGTFERTGQPAPIHFDEGPFSGGGLGAGPQINEGTVIGGGAEISLSGYSSGGSFGYTSAGLIEVNGAIAMTGAGNASVLARGNTITVTGNITLDAGAAQQDGTFAREYTGSGSSTVTETGTVVSDWGNADVDLAASGNVTVANISITGPGAGGRLEGANIRAGAITVNATGGSLVIDETSTVGGVSEQMHFEGPNTFTGFGLRADNTLELTGGFTLNAVGAGGALMSGTTIKTRDITINVSNGDYEVLAPDTFGATTNTFTAGNALLGIVGATAQVNGNVAITAGQQAHFGGAATATGNFDINASTGITRTIPDNVQFLNAVDSEDDDVTITLPAAFNVQASNIRLASTGGTTRVAGATLNATSALVVNGGAVNATGANLRGSTVDLNAGSRALTLNNATVNTPGALTMTAGTDILVSNVNLNADTIRMTAGRDVANSNPPATITTDALAISAGHNVNLANTTLIIGDGSFADITGDTAFLQLLAAEDIVVPATGPSLAISGNNIALGNLDVAGAYIYFETNQLQLNGAVNTSNADLLLQVAPTAVGGGFGFENTTSTSGTSYLYDGTLNAFDAATIALGTTNHTGDVAIGANGGIDIGDTNLFVLTAGNVTGLGLVTSTGVVKDLATLINGEFNVPQTDEIDTSQDLVQTLNNDYALESGGGDEEEEGDEEGEDTDTDTDVEEEDDSLIRQDTVDEEMMCR